MGWLLRNFLNLIGLPSDLDTLLRALGLAGGISLLTGWLSYAAGRDADLILLIALIAFAVVLAIIRYITIINRTNTVFLQLRLLAVDLAFPGTGVVQESGKQLVFIALRLRFGNSSARPMFMKLVRGDLSLQGKVAEKPEPRDQVSVIQQSGDQAYTLATISGIDPEKPIAGRLNVEVMYGPAKDDLRYKFIYIGEPSVQTTKGRGQGYWHGLGLTNCESRA